MLILANQYLHHVLVGHLNLELFFPVNLTWTISFFESSFVGFTGAHGC